MVDPVVVAARKFWRSRRGSVAILFGVMLTVLIGFVALGTEVGYAMYKQRQMQSAASAAAISGATAYMTGYPTDPTVEARAVAAAGGFVNGVSSATVTVNRPPLNGSYAGVASAVEVIVGQPQTLPMSGIFITSPWTVNARAVATVGSSASDCVLQLDASSTASLSVSNGATIALNQCGLAVNANGANALTVAYGSKITARSVTVVGQITDPGSGITVTNGKNSLQSAVTNPYSGTATPVASTCQSQITGNPPHVLGYQNPTVAAGTYCGGLTIDSGGSVTMSPGVYIINGGTFSVQGGTTVTGTGVTIVLTGSGSNYANASVGNGTAVTLSAPTTGATAGLVFLQDPKAPTSGSSSFQGGSTLQLTGALYFPTQTVLYANGASAGSTCTQLIAYDIQFAGGASFNSNCANTGVQTIGASPSRLVE